MRHSVVRVSGNGGSVSLAALPDPVILKVLQPLFKGGLCRFLTLSKLLGISLDIVMLMNL